MKFNFKAPASVLSAILVIVGVFMLAGKADPPLAALLFLPSALGPLVFNLLVAAICSPRSCQTVLTFAALLYTGWFTWVYMDIFYWHPDPQSAVGLIFAGMYAIPVILPLWLLTLWLKNRAEKRLRAKR
ncbi:MAG: hypothetical protein QM796_21420 [Chthoniobacteraceae bacterium]